MSENFYQLVRAYGGISVEYLNLAESDFATTPGAAYTPPERESFRVVATRTIQLMQEAAGVVETFQTSAGVLRLPANTGNESTEDAGKGRLFFFKNSGTGDITVENYLGTQYGTVTDLDKAAILVGNDNNTWDVFNFRSTQAISSGVFHWARSGATSNTFFFNYGAGPTPSNRVGIPLFLTPSKINDLAVGNNNDDITFTVNLYAHSGGALTLVHSQVVTLGIGVYNATYNDLNKTVTGGNMLACELVYTGSANKPLELQVSAGVVKG